MTGTEWLRMVQRRGRKLRRTNPDAYAVLMYVRDLLLDGAAAGVFDLSRPIVIAADDDGVTISQPDDEPVGALR